MGQSLLPGGPNIIRTPINGPDGQMSSIWQRFFSDVIQRLQNGLDIIGRFTGQIGAAATVEGHAGTLATTIQHLTPSGQLIASQLTGVIASAQLPPADPAAQGAVQLPTGAPTNILGSASLQAATDFDPAGAAATAQANAEAFSGAGDVTTLTAAKSYTDSKFPGVAAHTIVLLKLTGGGANGSITWNANGVITGFVDPT